MKKYKRALILSGGGSHFAIYAGIYSALVENNLAPDLLIASCGGSFAATVISSFVDCNRIKDYIKSYELYNFINSLTLTDERKFLNVLFAFIYIFLL